LPPPPASVSLPGPPYSVSAAAAAGDRSLPEPPFTVSMSVLMVSTSLPSPLSAVPSIDRVRALVRNE